IERDAVEHHVFAAVALRTERTMAGAEKARPGIVVRPVLHLGFESDELRDRGIDRAEQLRDRRAKRRPAARRLIALRSAGQAAEIRMVIDSVGDRPKDGESV